MARTLDEVIEALPPERRERVEGRFRELVREVEGLQALRQLAGRAQAEVAAALKIKQPSVSKIERQADMYLSTLRGYVEALGGTLELVVQLPSGAMLRLDGLGDLAPTVPEPPERAARISQRPPAKVRRRIDGDREPVAVTSKR